MWQQLPVNIYPAAVIAIVPLLWIFLGMLKFKLPAYKVSLIAVAISILPAVFIWKMPLVYTAQSLLEGIILGFWPILWVVFSAVFTYNLSVRSGAMGKIKTMLSGISPDRRIQALILAFGFGGFLEAAAGFGTAVAIPAGILAALGFEPLFAAIICLVANTIPVAFGAVGIPITTLAEVTKLPVNSLTIYTALQLLPFVLILPAFLVVLTTGNLKGLKGVGGISLASGLAFGMGQTLTAWFIGPELSAVIGSLCALGLLIVWIKLLPVKIPWYFPGENCNKIKTTLNIDFVEGLKAWSPYILILVLILVTRMIPFLDFLNHFPFELKQQFYFGPGGKPMSFKLITNPGTVIVVSALIGAAFQGVPVKTMFIVAWATLKQIAKTIATVLSIVSLAKIMGYSGMISSVAAALSNITGGFFPLISPLIGALGTFITGSDTSANVLFGELQKQTALQIDANPSWIAAANASGATAGKMISPQSIAIATTATNLSGSEAKILSKTMKYAAGFVILLGIFVYSINYFFIN
ncbi:MAG: L-lactate permease [Clostridia bacterium]|nr:L-lactate permease [Clostridia bacterium]